MLRESESDVFSSEELLAARRDLHQVQESLKQRFVSRAEMIRALLVALVAREHVLLIGPPGTAKSALIKEFAALVDAKTFDYLLTRFTEPNELFGPVDVARFREGVYERRTEGMLPTADIVFLDEIFKANSAILNSLLTLLNERVYPMGPNLVPCRLLSLFGASNEVPTDETLAAVFDRFSLRIEVAELDSFHFQSLLRVGWKAERTRITEGFQARSTPVLALEQLHHLHQALAHFTDFPESFLELYKDLVLRLRSEGVAISDRRVVKMLKLFAANALLDGRHQVNRSDLALLTHVWNQRNQIELIHSIVEPELEAFYSEHPEAARPGTEELDFAVLVEELDRTGNRLTGTEQITDVELFTHLRTLHDLKAAFQSLGTQAAQERLAFVDRLLEFVYQRDPSSGGVV